MNKNDHSDNQVLQKYNRLSTTQVEFFLQRSILFLAVKTIKESFQFFNFFITFGRIFK